MSAAPDLSSISDEQYAALLMARSAKSPFSRFLGWALEEVEPGRALARMPYGEHLLGKANVIHGGAVASLVDVAAAVAVISEKSAMTSTTNATVNLFLNYLSAPLAGSDLWAEARVKKRGRSIVNLAVEVKDAEGTVVATAAATYKVGTGLGVRK